MNTIRLEILFRKSISYSSKTFFSITSSPNYGETSDNQDEKGYFEFKLIYSSCTVKKILQLVDRFRCIRFIFNQRMKKT